MNTLILYAHPNEQSFNHEILNRITTGLREGGHTFKVLDLYKEKFDPVLIFNEDKKRRFLAHDEEMEGYRNLVKEADHIIFIYPIWWYGMPAILKGFIDRVFVSDFAYTYEGSLPKGLLKNKSAWVIYTLDSPSWYVRFFRFNAEWIIMKHAILKFCGFGKIKRFMFAGLKNSKREQRYKWLNHLYHTAKKLGK